MKIETLTVRAINDKCERCGKNATHVVMVEDKKFHVYCADQIMKDNLLKAQINKEN